MKNQLTAVILFVLLFALVNGEIDSSFNLPRNVRPIRYTLTVETNLTVNNDTSSFNGSVIIELRSCLSANNITLHSRKLDINNDTIRLVSSNGTELGVLDVEIDEEREFYVIYFEEELLANEYYNLTIGNFSGKMKHDNIGFYLAKYEVDEEERYVGVTDFEPVDARKAFPCFDDPSMKAKFLINIVRPGNYSSLSNEKLVSTTDLGNDRFMDSFKETVIMPTYVVAYLVSDYKHTRQIERHRVFARASAIDAGKLDYALNVAVEMLQALEDYTGINYTSTKMDQVAIPHKYYNDEAMENWGLVTFSEKHLFISNDTSTAADRERNTIYIAHEFAHQWFGNLVTFKEWRYLWLSEGFGAFFQYYMASLVRPSWRLMDRFVIATLHKILDFDSDETESLNNYRQLHIGSIPSPWICYFKASSVLRMIQHFLTPDIFRKGLQHYLKENKFKNAEPKTLYSAFQKVINETGSMAILGNNSVSSIMETWDSQAGFPLVTIQRNYDDGTITIYQHRHTENEDLVTDHIWFIPISHVYQLNPNKNFSDTRADLWLTEKNKTIDDGFNGNGWFLINKQQTGYYRVNYDLKNWNMLATYLINDDYTSIDVVNRAQLINDAFNLAHLGKIPYYVPLNLTKYLVREVDYVPIAAFVDCIPHLTFLLSSSKLNDVYQNYVINVLDAAYDYVGFNEKDNDTHLDKLNRVNVIKWVCRFGHSECRNSALKKLKEWRETGDLLVPPDLKELVICNALRISSMDDWEFIYDIAINESKVEYNMYYSALACSEDSTILNEYLGRLLNNNFLLTKDGRTIFRDIIKSSSVGMKVGVDFITNATIPSRNQAIFAYDVGERCTSEEQFRGLYVFNTTLKEDIYDYALDRLSSNIQLVKGSYLSDIEQWLREYNTENIESSNVVR